MRDQENHGDSGEMLCIPFSMADGSVLFNNEYHDGGITGGNSIPATSQLNMYGGWCVTQLPGVSVPSCETSYTGFRESGFLSWSGANYNGTGAPTSLDIFLVWRKDQFTGNTAGNVFGFGATAASSTLRIDFTDLIADGDNEIRFAILNRESATDTWYISEASYDKPYIGDGYFEITGFNGSSAAGKRWAVINPTSLSFAIPSSLSFVPKTFSDIRAVGLLYHGQRSGYHYNFGFNRFIMLGTHN